MKKYFKTLGLEKDATQEQMQEAYERLSKELDPANNDNQEFFVEEFALLKEAYKALTGKEPNSQTTIDTKASDVSDLFEDSDSILSILKKFKGSEDAKKLEIIKSLEAFKNGNKTYQQALAMVYKKEDIDGLRATVKKEKAPKSEINNENSNNKGDDDLTKKPFQKYSKKNIKLLLGSLAFILLFFGVLYIYFLTKVNTFEKEIPRIVEQSQYNHNVSRRIWETKFFEDHPEIVASHLTDNTNKGFLFKESDSKFFKDSIVKFFVYSKAFPLVIYKPDFFECVYYDAVNSHNFWNHYIVGQSENWEKNENLPPYLEMLKKTEKNYRVSDKVFEDLIQMAGGLKAFQLEKPSSIDIKCKKCIENYQNTFETNNISINDFYDFTDEYFAAKNEIEKKNKSFLKKYDKSYRKLTTGMNKSLRTKLKLKLEENSFPSKKSITNVFYGSTNGLGDISFSFDYYQDESSTLKDYVNEIYASYYSTNSLYTGARPYSYCYGKNPYCYPPDGYEECSFIGVEASLNSDVVVIIKKNNQVYAHAYIKAGEYYKFKVGNGSFQTFFYYGKGWNPNKYIKTTSCGKLTGGFVTNESLDKSDIQKLYNRSMTYTLYTVQNGNFKPKVSNKDEAF